MKKESKDLRDRLYWRYIYGEGSQSCKNAKKLNNPEIRIIKMVLNLLRGGICRVENYPPKALKPLKH
jgi:hypothetical protein